MAVKLIKFYGDPILRNKSKQLEPEEFKNHQELYNDLMDTMLAVQGVGLAAVQIGFPVDVHAVDPRSQEEYRGRMPFIMINPVITDRQNLKKNDKPEACLSVPGATSHVDRYETITFEYYQPDGTKKTETVSGLFANIVQHEIDHSNGVLYVDHLKPQTKELIVNKFKKTKRHALNNQGDRMKGNYKYLELVSEANRKALQPFIKETVKESMSELKEEILQEIVKYTDRLTQATGVRMRTLERVLLDKIDLNSEEKLASVTMDTEDELLGLEVKSNNSDTVEEGDYVRVKVRDPKGEMEDRNWSFTRIATTPYETGNEQLEKSVLGMKTGEKKEVEVNYNNSMLNMELEVINIRTYSQEHQQEVNNIVNDVTNELENVEQN